MGKLYEKRIFLAVTNSEYHEWLHYYAKVFIPKNPLQNTATFCFCSSKLIQFMHEHVCALMNTDFLKAVEGIKVLIAWMYDHSSPLWRVNSEEWGHLRRWSLPLLYGLDSLGSRQAWKAHYKMQMWKRMNRRKLWKIRKATSFRIESFQGRWVLVVRLQTEPGFKNYNPAHIKYTHHLCIYLKQCFHSMLTLRLKIF